MAYRSSRNDSLPTLFGKGRLYRLSLIFFILASLGLLILAKMEDAKTRTVSGYIIDAAVPVMDIFSRPIDFMFRIGDSFEELTTIRSQNTLLREENTRLREKLMYSLQIESENAHLQRLLNFVGKPNPQYIAARVVGDTSGPFLQSAIINAGSNDGVRKGQAVVNEKGLVGRIIEAGARSSRLLLVTDINSRIPIVTSRSRERAVLAGNNEGMPELLYLPDDTRIEIGEVVLTSGDGDVFPIDQPIGVVESREKDNVTVRPFVEWNRLEYVSVVDY
jgi:rod shape-determining protein MreC